MQYKCSPDRISITAGTIDEESVTGTLPKIDHHVFVGAGKGAGWYDIPDHLPRYSEFSTGFQKRIDEWKKVFTAPGLG